MPDMTEILLFHHAQGLTEGIHAFADELRAAGHVVHTPDFYDGKAFASLDDGIANAKEIGFGTILDRGVQAADAFPSEIVYAGFSMGVMAAQKLTQTRPGAKGALMLHSSIPLDEFGGTWPKGVPAQIHTMEKDDWGDVDVGRELADTVDDIELFVYPGDRHLFTDRNLPDYDEGAAKLVMLRALQFLDSIETPR